MDEKEIFFKLNDLIEKFVKDNKIENFDPLEFHFMSLGSLILSSIIWHKKNRESIEDFKDYIYYNVRKLISCFENDTLESLNKTLIKSKKLNIKEADYYDEIISYLNKD